VQTIASGTPGRHVHHRRHHKVEGAANNGLITSRNSYDPFGQRRPATGAADPGQTIELDWDPALNRRTGNGFTGHEHLDDVGIVHMNGRIFDPKLGVFMQPDSLIQQPNNLQNYNRYIYCINGPMGCTDPSGLSFLSKLLDDLTDKWWAPPGAKLYIVLRATANTQLGYEIGTIAIAVASAYCTGYAVACNAAGQAAWAGFSGASANDALKVGVQAGLSTYANTLIGDYTSGFGNAAAHAAWGCAEGELSSGDCGSGARGAFASALISSPSTTYGNPYANVGDLVVNTAIQAGVGGLAAVAGGGKFAQGARSAAFAYLFNCVAHKCSAADYDPNDPNFHEFGPFASSICDTSAPGCLDAARQQLLCNSAPGQGQCATVGVEVSQGLSGGNPITQYAPSQDMVINGTSPRHIFDDGYVVRWLAVDDAGIAQIWTYGRGVNTSVWTTVGNQYGGEAIFRYIGIRNSAEANRKIKKDRDGP
jgi:RHS repeat-associated protein